MGSLTRDGRLNSSRETKFSGTHGNRGIFIFPVQLTTNRIGNLTRLIHALLYVMTIHTYISVELCCLSATPDCICVLVVYVAISNNSKKETSGHFLCETLLLGHT